MKKKKAPEAVEIAVTGVTQLPVRDVASRYSFLSVPKRFQRCYVCRGQATFIEVGTAPEAIAAPVYPRSDERLFATWLRAQYKTNIEVPVCLLHMGRPETESVN